MLILAAVLCRFLISAFLPAGTDVQALVQTAAAWQGYSGECDKQGRAINKFGRYENSPLTVRLDLSTGRVSVWGSLQSYWQGSNVAPFGWPDVLSALQAVAEALQLPSDLLRVHVLETGVTVPTGQAPSVFLAKLVKSTYGPLQAPFYATEPPADCPPLQYVARTNETRIKVYNKGAYAKLKGRPLPPGPSGQGFRFEVHYLKARRLGAALGWNGAITWATLMLPEVYSKLAARLLESWQQIHLPAAMDTQNLSIDERALLIAGQHPEFWAAGKRETPPATYKRKRALFNKLQQAQAHKPETGNPYTADVERIIKDTLPQAEK